jgi:hypothetical protein
VTLPANVTGGHQHEIQRRQRSDEVQRREPSYEPDGHLTRDATNSYTWDARNHLIAISGGATASFVYDALGRRMKKVIAGTTPQFLHDDSNPVQELNSSN